MHHSVPVAGGYVYDPYPAVMKAAPFKLLCRDGIKALGPNTHLWYSEEPVEGFPGRTYKVEEGASIHVEAYQAICGPVSKGVSPHAILMLPPMFCGLNLR